MTTQDFSRDDVMKILNKVMDPEIPVVSLIEMGIIRNVEFESQKIIVTITPTFSGCPALKVMQDDIRTKLEVIGLPVDIKTVLAPAWTSDWITEGAKQKLASYGIAPPDPVNDQLIQLEPAPKACPKCGSINTRMTNTFGSTLCKTIHTCNNCLEPFEAFKTV